LTTLAFATLAPHLRAEASSITGVLRNVGGSVGIAAMQALNIANGARMHEALAAHVRPDDPMLRATLPAGLSPESVQGALRLNEEITRQANMVAFLDDYRLMAFISLCAVPLLLLLRQRR